MVIAKISGSFLYGLASCESNGLMPDFINMLAKTKYFKQVVLLLKTNTNYQKRENYVTQTTTLNNKIITSILIYKIGMNLWFSENTNL